MLSAASVSMLAESVMAIAMLGAIFFRGGVPLPLAMGRELSPIGRSISCPCEWTWMCEVLGSSLRSLANAMFFCAALVVVLVSACFGFASKPARQCTMETCPWNLDSVP